MKVSKAAVKKAERKGAAPAPPRRAARRKAGETVTLKTVFEQLAEDYELPKRVGQAMANDLVAAVRAHLKNGDRLRMSGLGILEVRDRPARMAVTRRPARRSRFPPARKWRSG